MLSHGHSRGDKTAPQTKNKAPSFGFEHTESMKMWEKRLFLYTKNARKDTEINKICGADLSVH